MIGISAKWCLGFTVQGSCLSLGPLGFVLIAPFHEAHGLFTETVFRHEVLTEILDILTQSARTTNSVRAAACLP